MKEAEEIAYEFIKTCGFKRVEIKHKDLTNLIKQIRAEQDKITRHACADAVLQCDEDVSGSCIWRNSAHSACLNAKSV